MRVGVDELKSLVLEEANRSPLIAARVELELKDGGYIDITVRGRVNGHEGFGSSWTSLPPYIKVEDGAIEGSISDMEKVLEDIKKAAKRAVDEAVTVARNKCWLHHYSLDELEKRVYELEAKVKELEEEVRRLRKNG